MRQRLMILALVFVLSGLGGLGLTSRPGVAQAAATPSVSIQPPAANVPLGGQVTVSVETQTPPAGVSAYQFNITYDSTVVTPLSFTTGAGTTCNLSAPPPPNTIACAGANPSSPSGMVDLTDLTFTTAPGAVVGAMSPLTLTVTLYESDNSLALLTPTTSNGAITIVAGGATTAPAKSCAPLRVAPGGNTVCTLSLTTPLGAGSTLVDTVSSPAGATLLACGSESGGLVCGTPAGAGVTVTCTPSGTATSCPTGASVALSITASGAGALAEQVVITPPSGPAASFTVLPSPGVSFLEVSGPVAPLETAPAKRCTPSSVPLGGSAVCTLTLTAPLGPSGSLVDTLTSPAGAGISGCSATGGLACQPQAPNLPSITVTCPGPSPCPMGATITLTLVSNSAGPLTETVTITPAGYQGQSFSVTASPGVLFGGAVAAPTQVCNGQTLPLFALCPLPVTQPTGPQPLPALLPLPPGLS